MVASDFATQRYPTGGTVGPRTNAHRLVEPHGGLGVALFFPMEREREVLDGLNAGEHGLSITSTKTGHQRAEPRLELAECPV